MSALSAPALSIRPIRHRPFGTAQQCPIRLNPGRLCHRGRWTGALLAPARCAARAGRRQLPCASAGIRRGYSQPTTYKIDIAMLGRRAEDPHSTATLSCLSTGALQAGRVPLHLRVDRGGRERDCRGLQGGACGTSWPLLWHLLLVCWLARRWHRFVVSTSRRPPVVHASSRCGGTPGGRIVDARFTPVPPLCRFARGCTRIGCASSATTRRWPRSCSRSWAPSPSSSAPSCVSGSARALPSRKRVGATPGGSRPCLRARWQNCGSGRRPGRPRRTSPVSSASVARRSSSTCVGRRLPQLKPDSDT
jgi:hypothetical protein